MKYLVDYVLDRLSERSTYLGLIAVATGAGAAISPVHASLISTGGAIVFGVILGVTRDHKPLAEAVSDAVEEVTGLGPDSK